MHLRTLDQMDAHGKRILVRVDFNVSLDEVRNVKERYKVESARLTVDYLTRLPGTKVALITHFGRPEGKENDAFSVRHIEDDAARILKRPITFVPACEGEAVSRALAAMQPGEVLLLENVRFHPGEEQNDMNFATRLVMPFDLFVNEAFSVCHRDQASVTAAARLLPSCAGFHLADEVKHLSEVVAHPKRPAVAIIGGAKIETKLPVIRRFEEKFDTVLIGSKIADEAREQGMHFSDKVILPEDFAGNKHLDIGPRTVQSFVKAVEGAATVVWNGPLGKFEEKPYDQGTAAILGAIIGNKEVFSVVGGGETVEVLEEHGVMEKISFVSTGGGAMLDFLGGAPMPGLSVLEDK